MKDKRKEITNEKLSDLIRFQAKINRNTTQATFVGMVAICTMLAFYIMGTVWNAYLIGWLFGVGCCGILCIMFLPDLYKERKTYKDLITKEFDDIYIVEERKLEV